jgi:hypothetical protein
MLKQTLALVALTLSLSVQAAVVYSNGNAPFESATYYSDYYTVYDNFVLSDDAHITGIEWLGGETQAANYIDTEYFIYDGAPGNSSVVASGTVSASRASTGGSFAGYNIYSFAISDLSIELGAGSYYLGLSQNAGDARSSGWFGASNSPLAGNLYQQSFSTLSGPFDQDVNFRLVSRVPVPAAAWLFSSALIGLAGIKRKK